MGGGFLASMKRWILWDYPRGSFQYDLMVALILAFIFLTPRAIFRDHPKPKEVVLVPAEGRGAAFWIEPELLDGVPEGERLGRVDALVRRQGKTRNLRVTRVEPIFDAEQEVRGYMAFADPAE